MRFAILIETDGDVGGVGELEVMSVSIKQSQKGGDNFSQILGRSVQGHHEPIVGERGFNDLVQRFLSGDVLSLFQNNTSDRFGIR